MALVNSAMRFVANRLFGKFKMYIVSRLGHSSIESVSFDNVTPIHPDEFVAKFYIRSSGSYVNFNVAIVDDGVGADSMRSIQFTQLLLSKYRPQFGIDSDCFLGTTLSASEVWEQALETAIICTKDPKVKFSRKKAELVAEFSFGDFHARAEIPFDDVSHLLR